MMLRKFRAAIAKLRRPPGVDNDSRAGGETRAWPRSILKGSSEGGRETGTAQQSRSTRAVRIRPGLAHRSLPNAISSCPRIAAASHRGC